MLKRLKVIILSMLFTCIPNISCAANIEFKDLTEEHWAYEEIMVLAQRNVLNGYEDGTFQPDKEVTREEFTHMMNKSGFIGKNLGINFGDVAIDRWSYDSIQLYGKSIAENKNNWLYFCPTQVLNRQEAAKLLVISSYNSGDEYSESECNLIKNNYGNLLDGFIDKDKIRENYSAYVYMAYNKGIMQGVSNNEFLPEGNLTRAQAAALIYRLKYSNINYFELIEDIKDINLKKEDLKKIDNMQIEKFLKNKDVGKWYSFEKDSKCIDINIFEVDRDICVEFYLEDFADRNLIKENEASLNSHKSDLFLTCTIDDIKLMAERYGFLIKKDGEQLLLIYEVKDKKYYQEIEKNNEEEYSIVSVQNMIFFILNNEKDKLYSLQEAKLGNELSKIVKKYSNNKKYYYGEEEEAEIEISENREQIVITYYDKRLQKSKKYIYLKPNPVETFSIDFEGEPFEKIFEYLIFSNDNKSLIKYKKDDTIYYAYLSMTFPQSKGIRAFEFYEFIAFIINQNGLRTTKMKSNDMNYNLKFEDIITSLPPKYVSNNNKDPHYHIFVSFDRDIEKVDVDVINSKNQSVHMSTLISKDYSNGSNPDLNRNKLLILIRYSERESYKLILKNLVDVDGNATPLNKEYIYEFGT